MAVFQEMNIPGPTPNFLFGNLLTFWKTVGISKGMAILGVGSLCLCCVSFLPSFTMKAKHNSSIHLQQ